MIDNIISNCSPKVRNNEHTATFDTTYIYNTLLPALTEGNWKKLEELIVYQDQEITIFFKENTWRFLGSRLQAKSVGNLVFKRETGNVTHIHSELHENFTNELKCFALAKIYFSKDRVTLKNIGSHISSLRNMIPFLMSKNISSFSQLKESLLFEINTLGYKFNKGNSLSGLNALIKSAQHLHFDMSFNSTISHKDLNVAIEEAKQYPVIPLRIYTNILNQYSTLIKQAYSELHTLKAQTEKFQKFIDEQQADRIYKLRHGLVKLSKNEKATKSVKKFLHDLKENGIELVDSEKSKRWIELFKKNHVSLTMPTKRVKKVSFQTLNGETVNFTQFKEFRKELVISASWLCLFLSGMRVNELHSMHHMHGSQKTKVRKDEPLNKSPIKPEHKASEAYNPFQEETIYLLTTRQSKITGNSQTKDDVYVTTEVGYKSFKVLSALMNPQRKRVKSGKKLFYSLDKLVPIALKLKTLDYLLNNYFNAQNVTGEINLKLDKIDVEHLDISEKKHQFKIKDIFQVTTHMCRRSLAYYLVGFELCSFPALKQQFSHVSLHMTRWYARNASSFLKFYSEIQEQRMQSKAKIFARIFNKIANSERIAGGKGKQKILEISKLGKNYFEDGVNKSLLNPDFWYKQLSAEKEHIHAIAPGMYCTNKQCSMRVNIDLTECVDCEYDYIEDVVFAESTRFEAMRHLSLLEELDDLSPPTAARLFTQIKASEKIMSDLNFDYEPYQFNKKILDMVIVTRSIN